MGDGEDEEAVAVVRNTGEGVIPSCKCRQETEEATGLDDGGVGLALGVTVEITNTEEQEGEVQEEEQQEEGYGGPQGAEQQDSGEDEPSKEEQSKRVIELWCTSASESVRNLKSTWGQDDGESKPETTIRRQSGGTKGISNGHFPHASKQLNKTTIAESQSDHNVGLSDVARTHVDRAQHESGEGESRQAQRGWVTELAVLDRLVQTGLELTTEGTQLSLSGVDVSERAISEARSSPGCVLSGQLVGGSSSVDTIGVVSEVLLERLGILFSGHDAHGLKDLFTIGPIDV